MLLYNELLDKSRILYENSVDIITCFYPKGIIILKIDINVCKYYFVMWSFSGLFSNKDMNTLKLWSLNIFSSIPCYDSLPCHIGIPKYQAEALILGGGGQKYLGQTYRSPPPPIISTTWKINYMYCINMFKRHCPVLQNH